MNIHSTAIIGKDTQIDESAQIGAYAIIEDGVRIGKNTKVEPHARVRTGSIIGENCLIGSFTVIAGDPQDLHFDLSTVSFVEIGDGTVVRESSTIHRATVPNGATKVGKNCLLMASSHIGHDSILGDNCILGCFSALAGHTIVEKDAFVSGGVMIHQRNRIGQGAMISGNSAFSLDVPPFVNGLLRNNIAGLNIIGMKRRGFTSAEINDAKAMYHLVYATPAARKNALAAIEANAAQTRAGKIFLEFFIPEGHHYATPKER